jgi:hypothetical protein
MDAEIVDALQAGAVDLKERVVEKIVRGVPPPNAESTVRKKGHGHTLMETGEMMAAVTWQITGDADKATAEVGIFDPEIAERALINEFGSIVVPNHPPQRSFLRSTFDENIDRILKNISNSILDYLEDALR